MNTCNRTRGRVLRRGRSANMGGWTLIELLTGILILLVLMNISLPLYLASAYDAQLKACRTNMQTISDAEAAYRNASATHQFTTTLTNLSANLPDLPKCPAGGTYAVTISNGSNRSNGTTVPSGMLIISCTGSSGGTAHGTFAPGIDAD